MTASLSSESRSAPGDTTRAITRRPEVVVVRGLDRRGYEYIGNTPRNTLKIYDGPPRRNSFSATFSFASKMVVLIVLKLHFGIQLLRYLHRLPHLGIDNFPDRLFEVSEILLCLAGVTGADSLWSRKSNVALLSSRYFKGSEGVSEQCSPGPPSFWHDKFIPLLLISHTVGGVSLYFVSNLTIEGDSGWCVNCSFVETFRRLFFINVLALSQAYIAWTVYATFCLDVRRTMQYAADELQRSQQSITHDGLSRIHSRWELCSRYLGDLNYNFLGFVCTWYCYLFVKAVYLFTLVCSTVFPASRGALTRHEVCVPMFELTVLVILCVISDKVKATLCAPVEHLKEVSMSRPTEDVAVHVEVQRFLYRIRKYSSMTLWKLSTWTENAVKSFAVAVVALLVLQDKRVRAKLL
ncbi:hypothetical protein HPB50_025724 [Hyalomma asiaticum]|uniref:Uncharacterized protein n=1 Tax=Hyalomma asiaticum TaxID=266040 RepID=A0ACB7RVD5_HYAAI|nr:hypothetical protein HPB50_025724 [Hyalomma asiaticum]